MFIKKTLLVIAPFALTLFASAAFAAKHNINCKAMGGIGDKTVCQAGDFTGGSGERKERFSVCRSCTTTMDLHCHNSDTAESNAITTVTSDTDYRTSSSALTCSYWGGGTNSNGPFRHYTCTNWDPFSKHYVIVKSINCKIVDKNDGGKTQ